MGGNAWMPLVQAYFKKEGIIKPSPADNPTPPPANEPEVVLDVFRQLLKAATGDGSKKRQAGLKPPWWCDPAHEKAIFSHLHKWKKGEKVDPDSGVHPLVHLAWRALAIAYQETYGLVDPASE